MRHLTATAVSGTQYQHFHAIRLHNLHFLAFNKDNNYQPGMQILVEPLKSCQLKSVMYVIYVTCGFNVFL